MNIPGHFWCDHCDDNAYGPVCLKCHRDAEFVHGESPVEPPVASPPRAIPSQVVSDEEAHLLFQAMRKAL